MIIDSREDLEKWVSNADAAAAIASRCALRLLPLMNESISPELSDEDKLLFLRLIFVSAVRSVGSVDVASDFGGHAATAVENTPSRVPLPFTASDSFKNFRAGLSSCLRTLSAKDVATAALCASNVLSYAEREYGRRAISEVAEDVSILTDANQAYRVYERPLWKIEPAEFRVRVADFLTSWEDQPDWLFWRDWYRGILEGNPLNWDLQRQIALIPQGEWDQGPTHTAKKIAETKAEFAVARLPQAEEIRFDLESASFFTVPTDVRAEKLVETTLKQVEFALSVALKSNCGLNFSSTCYLYITHCLDDCRSDPNAIEQNLEIAAKEIDEGLKSGYYEADAKLNALQSVLEKGVLDLRANHPEVAEAWEKRSAHALKNLGDEQRAAVIRKVTELVFAT